MEDRKVVSAQITIPPTRGILTDLPELLSPGEKPIRISVVVDNKELYQSIAIINDMRLGVGSEDLVRQFRGWEIVSWTSSPEPKGLTLNLRSPRSCRALQVSPALDDAADDDYVPCSSMSPVIDLNPPSRHGPAHKSVFNNPNRQVIAGAAAPGGVGILAGAGSNVSRATRCGHVQVLTEPTVVVCDYEDDIMVNGGLDAANLKEAVTRALALPTRVNCASAQDSGRPSHRFDESPVVRMQSQSIAPVQWHRSDSSDLKLLLMSPPQRELQDLPQSQSQLQHAKLQVPQSEEAGMGKARYNNHFTGDGVLDLRATTVGDVRDARSGQVLRLGGSNAGVAAPWDTSRPHDPPAWRSDMARQDVQLQQQLRDATDGTGPELYISRDPFAPRAPTHNQLPCITLDDPPIRRGSQVSPSGKELWEPQLTAALLIPHAFVSHSIPNARYGDQFPVVLTVNDGSRGEVKRYGMSATEAAAEAAATSGHYPGALMVQRDGSGVLADIHISEAIAKYNGWVTVGWHIAKLDESLGGVYWVEWRVHKPPPPVPAQLSIQPQPVLQPRQAAAVAAARQRCDRTEEANANDEGTLLKALQILVWQQKALEEQLARMQARRVTQHEKQRLDLHQSSPDELKGLLPLQQQQQGDVNQGDELQAHPVLLRQRQNKVLGSTIVPGPLQRQPQLPSERIRADAAQPQAERDGGTEPAKSAAAFGCGLAGTADDAKHCVEHTGSKKYDAGVGSRDLLVAIASSTCRGSRPSKRCVQGRMAEAVSFLMRHPPSGPQPELSKPPNLPQLQQQQLQPPRLQLKAEAETRLDSLKAVEVTVGTPSPAGSGNIDELKSTHSPSGAGGNVPSSPSALQTAQGEAIASSLPVSGAAEDRSKKFRGPEDGTAAAEKQAPEDGLRMADDVEAKVAPLDTNEGAAPVPDSAPPGSGQFQASGASLGTLPTPEDDLVVARSAPRQMSRYLTSGEIRVLFTERDSRVLCNPPCGLLLMIQIFLDGQPLGPPQEAQLCRYNGSSPRYLTSVPAQELTSPPIPWKRLAETTIQYRRCRSGLLRLWATRRRGASAGRGPEEGVLQLTAKAAAGMPKLVSFKPAGLRRAAWLAASGSGAGDGDCGGIDGYDDGDDDGDGISGNADAAELSLKPAPGSLSAGAVRGLRSCSPAGCIDSNGAGRPDSAGVMPATQPTNGGFGAFPSSYDGDRNGGGRNFTITVGGGHEDAAHATEHQVQGPLDTTDARGKLEGNRWGLDPFAGPIGLGNIPNDLNRGMHYNSLLGELRSVGGRCTAVQRSRAEAAAACDAADESPAGTEPQFCTEVLVACRPRSLSRYVTKAELELLVGQEVYEQLCGGNKLADVRVMFEVNGRRHPEVFIADIERYNASSPFYLKAASGRGVDGLPWRSVPPNATVQWRRMADNTLVLAQVSNTTHWDSNGRNTTEGRISSSQRRGSIGTTSKHRVSAGRGHKNDLSDDEYGSGDTKNDVQPSQKRRRTRKAARAWQPSQGDDLLEALAGAAGRALMEERRNGVNEIEEGKDEDENEEAGRRRKSNDKVPDLVHRSHESSASPAAAAGEPQIPGGTDTHHHREAGDGATAGRALSLLQSVACSGGLGVLTCPSPPTQSQLTAGNQGPSSFISRIVATNLYIGRRQLQALYGPGFKADTRSDMQLSLNGTLAPDIYHVQWKEGCHKGSFYPKGAPLGQLRGRFLQGIYWLDEPQNLLVAVAWDQPPPDWPVRRRRMTAASSGLGAPAKPRRWLWQRQAERVRKASAEMEGTAVEASRGLSSEAIGGLGRLQYNSGGGLGTGLDAGEEQGGSGTEGDSGRSDIEPCGNPPTNIQADEHDIAAAPCKEQATMEGVDIKGSYAAAEVLAAAAEQECRNPSWGTDGDALAAGNPRRRSEAQVATGRDRAHKENIEGLQSGRPAEDVSLTEEPTQPHGGTRRVSCGSSDTGEEAKVGSPRAARALQHPPSPQSRPQESHSEYVLDMVEDGTELATGVDVSMPMPAAAENRTPAVVVSAAPVLGLCLLGDEATRCIDNRNDGGCPKRSRMSVSAVADENELGTGIATKKARGLDSEGHLGKFGQPRCERQQSQEGPGDQIQQLDATSEEHGFCTLVAAATSGRAWGKDWPDCAATVATAVGRGGLVSGVAGMSGEDCSTDDCLEEIPSGESPLRPSSLNRYGSESIAAIPTMQVLQLVRNMGERGGCASLLEAYQQQQYLKGMHNGVNASRQDQQGRIQIAAALAPLIAAMQSPRPVPEDDDGDDVATANSNAIIDGSEECAEVTDELVIRTMPWISMHLAQKWYPDAVFSTDHPPYRVQIAIEVDGQLQPARYPAQLKSYSFNNSVFLPGLPVKLVKGMIRTGWRKLKDQTLVLVVRSTPSATPEACIGGRAALAATI